jgi:hypothetical protein
LVSCGEGANQISGVFLEPYDPVLVIEVAEEIVVVDMGDDVDERIGLEDDVDDSVGMEVVANDSDDVVLEEGKGAGEARVTKKATSVPPPRNTTKTSTVTTRPIP